MIDKELAARHFPFFERIDTAINSVATIALGSRKRAPAERSAFSLGVSLLACANLVYFRTALLQTAYSDAQVRHGKAGKPQKGRKKKTRNGNDVAVGCFSFFLGKHEMSFVKLRTCFFLPPRRWPKR